MGIPLISYLKLLIQNLDYRILFAMSLRQLAIGASGIYFAYLSASVLSQKLYTTKYQSIKNPEELHDFNHPALLVWISCLLCSIFGFIKGKAIKQVPNPVSIKQQLILGCLFIINMLAANYALLYISFLNKVIGGNLRYFIVVVIGVYFSRVKKGSTLKLSAMKIVVALLITTGILIFTIASYNEKKVQNHIDPDQEWKGYLFMTISVFADALFSDSQAFSKVHFHPTANHLFTSANFLGFIFTLAFSIVTGQADNQFRFCIKHPTVIVDILALGSFQVLGQVCIYYVVANFKQHMFPLISTTRKVLTVILSIIVYRHSVNIVQWFAIFLVFGGLAYQLNDEMQSKKKTIPSTPQLSSTDKIKPN